MFGEQRTAIQSIRRVKEDSFIAFPDTFEIRIRVITNTVIAIEEVAYTTWTVQHGTDSSHQLSIFRG